MRARDQKIDRRHLAGQHHRGDAGADRERGIAVLERESRHGGPQPLPDPAQLAPVGGRKQKEELVAAEPGDEVGAANGSAKTARDLPQRDVPHGVAERVVHGLEIVDVDHEHGHVDRIPLHPFDQLRERALQPAPVQQLGQGIDERHPLEAHVRLLKRARDVGEPAPFPVPLQCVPDRAVQRAIRQQPLRDHVLRSRLEREIRRRVLVRENDERDFGDGAPERANQGAVAHVGKAEDHHVGGMQAHARARLDQIRNDRDLQPFLKGRGIDHRAQMRRRLLIRLDQEQVDLARSVR